MTAAQAGTRAPKAAGLDQIHSVDIAFRILGEVAASEDPIGVSEIARLMGEQKARVQRHLVTLKQLGALNQDAAGKYRLGWKLVELGQKAIAQFDLVGIAEPDVKALRDRTSLTSALAIVSGRGLRIAYVAESAAMMAITVRTGLAVPLHGSAAGRLLIAYGVVVDEPAAPDAPRAKSAMRAGSARARAIRERGYEYSVGEITSGVHSIGAPVFDPNGQMIAALVCIGTHTQITDPPGNEIVQAVKRFAGSIGKRLRHTPETTHP